MSPFMIFLGWALAGSGWMKCWLIYRELQKARAALLGAGGDRGVGGGG